MDAREETLNILNKIWVKLQGLPNAEPIELGAFFVILTFICESPPLSIITHFIFFKCVCHVAFCIFLTVKCHAHFMLYITVHTVS